MNHRCPLCGKPAFARCLPCRATIRRRDGRVEEARVDGRVVFQRRPNAARALEPAGPQRAQVHANVSRISEHPLDMWLGGDGEAQTKRSVA